MPWIGNPRSPGERGLLALDEGLVDDATVHDVADHAAEAEGDRRRLHDDAGGDDPGEGGVELAHGGLPSGGVVAPRRRPGRGAAAQREHLPNGPGKPWPGPGLASGFWWVPHPVTRRPPGADHEVVVSSGRAWLVGTRPPSGRRHSPTSSSCPGFTDRPNTGAGLGWPLARGLPLFVFGVWLLTVTSSRVAVYVALGATGSAVGPPTRPRVDDLEVLGPGLRPTQPGRPDGRRAGGGRLPPHVRDLPGRPPRAALAASRPALRVGRPSSAPRRC